MLLPRPYIDEIIGSILLRGCRHLGIQSKRLSPLLRGGSTSPPSPFLPSCIVEIAKAAGLPPHEILYRHTVFPYVTAFMDERKVAGLEQRFLGIVPLENACFAALQRQAAITFLRVCPECIRDDLKRHGECYWHRSHQLPGVHFCLTHQRSLMETNVPAKGLFKMTLPNEAEHFRYSIRLQQDYLTHFAQASVQLLEMDHGWPGIEGLRALALGKNYCIGRDEVPAVTIVADVLRFYGAPFLREIRCHYSDQRFAWPSLILRTSAPELAPMKYLLMGIFLRSCAGLECPPSREATGYQRPGPRTDFEKLQRQAIKALQKRLKALAKTQQRITVKALLSDAGVWESYRHHRDQFPALAELLLQFRASDQSERQVGKRARWRK